MEPQKHIYKNRIEGDIEAPLQEGLTFEQLDILEKRKYRFRYILISVSLVVVLVLIFYGSAKAQWISAGAGSLAGAFRAAYKLLSTRSP